MKKFLLFTLIHAFSIYCIEISKEPIAICYNPNSILTKEDRTSAQYVENRSRLSTCTGVAWFSNGKQLISANLLESSFQTYTFDCQTNTVRRAKSWKESKLTKLAWPENLCFSKNGKWLAVTNSYTGAVNLYEVRSGRIINPIPIHTISIGDKGLHGIRFSNKGDFLAYVTYESPPKIRIFHIDEINKKLKLTLAYTWLVPTSEMAPKGIDFSPDDRYLAVCFSKRASSKIESRSGLVAIYPFDQETGTFHPITTSQIGVNEGLDVPEDLLFYPDGSCILVSNQGNDSISIHGFSSETGMITSNSVALESPEANLSFPHGISISPDGNYLAVSNYGDDKITIYKISK